jgi:DNA invertase Pin-like site-specific DNA recombinase
MKAFGYLRVSGRGQIDGDGFPRQRTSIKAYAETHGIQVVRWFEEKGICGENELDNRPALQELLVSLQSNGVRVVLIEKLDRLARKLTVQESIIADFQKNGFEIISVAEPDLCSDDPSRVLLRQFMGAIAEYDKKMIVLKLKAARQRMRVKVGRCEGRKQYGNRPGELEVIERMFAIYADGAGMISVHKQLNAEGIKTRYGQKWTPATVARIMKRYPHRLTRSTCKVSREETLRNYVAPQG